MSSPVRQMTSRRLPPLPGKGRRGHSPFQTTPSPKPASILPDMIITGHSPIYSTHTPSLLSLNHDVLMQDLTPDLVLQYLNHNPEFLDQYVQTQVSRERLDQWQERKSRPVSRYNNRQNGDLHPQHYVDQPHNLARWKSRIHSSKIRVVQELSREIHQTNRRAVVLHELSGCVAAAVLADGYHLYLVDVHGKEIIHMPNSARSSSITNRVGAGSNLAAYIAYRKESIRFVEPFYDSHFPEGWGPDRSLSQNHSVLALPIHDGNGSVIGVVEFYRKSKHNHFTEEEEEVAGFLLMWSDFLVDYVETSGTFMACGGIALYYYELYDSMLKQRRLNEFLLTVTKSVFQDIVSMDAVIMKIMTFAKTLVNADRASLFMVDVKRKELYARLFDTGTTGCNLQQQEIRFPMDRGVAGHVASTGEILNIADAYQDTRFNRDVDLQTGYHTESILCMPIYIRGNIIGVVQMVNKLNGTFDKADEEAFETFAIYCGLALHHAKLYEKIRRSEQKYRVALEVLSYHCMCSEEEFSQIHDKGIPESIPRITGFTFSPWDVDNDDKPLYVLYMFKDLFKPMRFDINDLIRFTLTVRKNYRNVPYHNWVHAFSVAHSMYTVIKNSKHKFTPVECLALYVACLCHDLDHRGKTNAFMVKSASPLATIYSTSTMEHHHFNQTVTILQQEGHNIFKSLSSSEYKQVLSDIRNCILATDLALFFPNHAKLSEIHKQNRFSWDIPEHRQYLMAVSMTACDLCAMFKPWETQLNLVYVIMEEFWQQGDEEKSQGMTPMPMMDREKKHELPQLEVGFIVGICLPCYELLADILPDTAPMVAGTKANLKKWQELADKQKENPDCKDLF